MDWYLSTYRKDYLWPYVRKFPIRALSENDSEKVLACKSAGNGRVRCTCGPATGGLATPKENPGPPVARAHEWNRCGSIAKFHPGKMGPTPEFEITRCDEPNTYLQKLQEKYPNIYNVLKSSPPDDITRRVNQDRLRTTYQVDYGHVDEHRDYNKLLAKAGIHSERINETTPYNIRPPDYSDTTTNRNDRFEDLRERLHEPGEFGGTFKEDTNYQNGFRYNTREFQDSRKAATNNIEPLEYDSEKAPPKFDHSREIGTKKYAFMDESTKSGRDSHEAFREASHIHRGESDGRDAHEDYREASNIHGRESGLRDAHEDYREASNTQKGESGGRDARVIKSGDGAMEAHVRSTEKKEEGKASAPPAWRSEYQEVIGQTGYDIIRDKIHRHGARSRGRSFVDRIIMRCRGS